MKRPSFQFYPGDWLRDTALRVCSIGARGLWIDMLCFMHEGSPYGHLKVNGKVILPANLASMIGATLPDTEIWLKELFDVGVYSVSEEGCIFSRRMIRDELVRNKRAMGGKLGGNPALKVNLPPNLEDANKVNRKPTPSSSSSSSSKIQSEQAPLPFASPEFSAAWSDWTIHRKEIRKALTPQSIRRQLKALEAMGEAKAIETINRSIEKGWTGLHEGNGQHAPQPKSKELRADDVGI